ncbi:MAG: hypothetical protein KAU48_05760 [Candidatus Thorarchaeota archaeon]|nr:hypothetical protein [Candidatus Thorarchaeota archaeon]
MAGAKKSAILFIIGSICFIIQVFISGLIFNDTMGAIIGVGFALIMLMGSIFAWTGSMSAVHETLYSYRSSASTVTTVRRDTGSRIQCTPCFGIGSGIGAIIVITMLGADLVGHPEFALLYPGIIGGVFGILAAIVFFFEYKGPYNKQV